MSTCLNGYTLEAAQPESINFNPTLALDSDFYIESNLEFTLLHELAHAVISLNDIPVLGGQEQAADQVALMLLLMADSPGAKELSPITMNKLLAISGEWMLEWQVEQSNKQTIFWGAHPLSIQRFYDVTCLAYGSDPDRLESLRKEQWLPVERAWDCDLEFQQTRKALAWLAKKVTDYEFDSHWNLIKRPTLSNDFSGQVKVVWVEPDSGKQKDIYKRLKSYNGLAHIINETNSILNIKEVISIIMEPYCKGPDAWWNPTQNMITMCYGLLEQFTKNAKLLPNLINQLKADKR